MNFMLSLCLLFVTVSAYWPAFDTPQPIPARSAPSIAIDPAKGYAVLDLGAGFYVLNEGAYFSAVVHKNGKLLVIDAPEGNWGDNYVQAINEVATLTGGTVTHMLYSHFHLDHIGSAGKVKAAWPDITIVAHAATTELILKDADPRRPIPDASFEKTYNWKLFGVVVEPIEVHCPGNIAIYSPDARVLMHIDVVFPRWMPFKALAYSDQAFRYLSNDAHDLLLAYDFDVFVAGHVGTLGAREDIIEAKELNDDIVASAQYAIANTDLSAAGATGAFTPGNPNFGNTWLGFSAYLNALSLACDEYLQALTNTNGETWSQRLGGSMAMGPSQCTVAITVLRVEGRPGSPVTELPEGHVNLDEEHDDDDDHEDDHDDDHDDDNDDDDEDEATRASRSANIGIYSGAGVVGLGGMFLFARRIRRRAVSPDAEETLEAEEALEGQAPALTL